MHEGRVSDYGGPDISDRQAITAAIAAAAGDSLL
jgi:hypothetical protein